MTRTVGGSPKMKVLDFGVSKSARSTGEPRAKLTRTRTMLGSPLYMAPEQMRSSRDVDARGDVWALGVVLFELLTGRSPFEAETMPELCLKIVSEPPLSLAQLRARSSSGARRDCRAMSREGEEKRYENAAELAQALAVVRAASLDLALAGASSIARGPMAVAPRSVVAPAEARRLPGGRRGIAFIPAAWGTEDRRESQQAPARSGRRRQRGRWWPCSPWGLPAWPSSWAVRDRTRVPSASAAPPARAAPPAGHRDRARARESAAGARCPVTESALPSALPSASGRRGGRLRRRAPRRRFGRREARHAAPLRGVASTAAIGRRPVPAAAQARRRHPVAALSGSRSIRAPVALEKEHAMPLRPGDRPGRGDRRLTVGPPCAPASARRSSRRQQRRRGGPVRGRAGARRGRKVRRGVPEVRGQPAPWSVCRRRSSTWPTAGRRPVAPPLRGRRTARRRARPNAAGRKDYLATALRRADGLAPKLARLTLTVTQPVAGLKSSATGSSSNRRSGEPASRSTPARTAWRPAPRGTSRGRWPGRRGAGRNRHAP